MALLSADEAQARGVGTNMDEDALQELIDVEEALMIRRFGPHGDGTTPVTEVRARQGRNIYPSRPFLSIGSVKTAAYPGGSLTTLAATSYYAWPNYIELYPGGLLVDEVGGAVSVTYVPIDDRALRREVLLSLVKLAIDQGSAPAGRVSGMGFSIEGGGATDWATQRATLYRRLGYFEV